MNTNFQNEKISNDSGGTTLCSGFRACAGDTNAFADSFSFSRHG